MDEKTTADTSSSTAPARPLRLWPGVALATAMLFLWFVVPRIFEQSMGLGVLGGAFLGVLIALWWLFFSKAPLGERWAVLGVAIAAIAVTSKLIHVSVAGGGMGFLFYIFAVPGLALALVVALVATRDRPARARRAAIGVAFVLICALFSMIRTGGISSGAGSDLHWRWTPTPEDRLLAQAGGLKAGQAAAIPADAGDGEWPGFRGPQRDGILGEGATGGTALAKDWTTAPPQALWRKPIGPGWSSFAVRGTSIYTQEQRGEQEVVACYDAATGEPIWQHGDTARFWESNGGAGPRGTPTLHGDRVYTFGGTGIVNALDASTGAKVWSRNAAAEKGAKTPTWGFASSPLVVGDLLIVAVSGQLVAYDLASGEERWAGPQGGASYSSPQLFVVDGVPQVLLLSAKGLVSVAPADGAVLWEHEWKGYPIVQPAITPEGNVLIAVNESSGTRNLAISRQAGAWKVEERWTSNGLKPYFNDFVVHRGHAIGFDGGILAAIDLADGKRKWKGGRYGQGQLLLLPGQDLLVVLSETGELALVEASTEKYVELARLPGIEGKTWNHPVLVGDRLLVRNDQEMAAFRLPVARG